MATPTRPTQPEGLDPAPDDDGVQFGGPQPDAAPEETEAAPQPEEMPLWTGPQTPAGDTAATEQPAGELDVTAAFAGVREAWTETVPEGTGHSGRALGGRGGRPAHPSAAPRPCGRTPNQYPTRRRCRRRRPGGLAEGGGHPGAGPGVRPAGTTGADARRSPVPAPTEGATGDPSGEQTDTPDPQQQVEAVNIALRGADRQAEAFKDRPE